MIRKENPIKSENDKKEYRVICLENGLTACLVSDLASLNVNESLLHKSDTEKIESESESEGEFESGSEIDQEENETSDDDADNGGRKKAKNRMGAKLAATSLNIGVGSFSDPKNIQGLAHFLEHMVFMGSEKFPVENDFDSFLQKRGGSDNATTDCEVTAFYFECQERDLSEALDKLSQFFIAPLLKRDAMNRERIAVDSEFQMAFQSDSDRREQLLLSCAPPDHPVNTFTWGNLITLRDQVSDDELYESLVEFRKRHYSSQRMTLAIQAQLSLDTLEQYVVDYFSKIPNNQLPPPNFEQYAGHVFDTPEFKRMYYVKPVKDICQLHLTWPLPSLLKQYKSRSQHYVAWLIGHEGKGSLKSYFMDNVWVLDISAGNEGSGSEYNSMYTLFSIDIVLSDEGFNHISEVLDAVFSYIKMLKHFGPQERIFKEIQSIKSTAFRFQDERGAYNTVVALAENMQFYPPEHYLVGNYLYLEYDPEGITNVINCLKPETVNIMISSTKLPDNIQYNRVEKWFKTPYYVKDIPKESIEKWQNIECYDCFKLPEPNIYLTNDFTLLTHDKNVIPEYPEQVLKNSLCELWYRPDIKFKLPIAYMYFYIITPMSVNSPQTASMVDLYVTMLEHQLNEASYDARVADLHHSIYSYEKGIMLKLNGYNEKLHLLLELILRKMKSFSSNLSEKLFGAIKEQIRKAYTNNLNKADKLAKEVRLSILVQGYWSSTDRLNGINDITYEMMLQFGDDLLKQLFIQALIQGNISSQDSIKITQTIENTLQCQSINDESIIPQYIVRQLPVGINKCCLSSYNVNDKNSTVTNYYQSDIGYLREFVIIELLMMLIEEPLFDTLRTKEQLGYDVFCTLRDTFGISGFSITVNTQADKFCTGHVDERIESFIHGAIKIIEEMPSDELNQVKNDLIHLKSCVDLYLQEEVERNWTEITSMEYIFDRLKRQIDFIKEITKDDVLDWFSSRSLHSASSNTHLRKLSIQISGHSAPKNEKNSPDNASKKENCTCKEKEKPCVIWKSVKDIEKFKNGLSTFPPKQQLQIKN
ncbi:nardilysin-like [Chrysoperla carnea]|uniref:nardilysin-like n=1 Tax=Chrysoperla carnea TaxID=189513 RepID=UPI001D08BE6F|nr:nardilysin-like [Chrysoperla carnea]